MPIVAKSFLHNDDKIVGTSGDADGNWQRMFRIG